MEGSWLGDSGLPLAVVEELFTRDLVALDRVDGDLLERHALALGLGRDLEFEMDRELAGTVEERSSHLLSVDGVVALPDLRLLDDGRLPNGLATVSLDGDDVGRVHRAHDFEVLALSTKIHEPRC